MKKTFWVYNFCYSMPSFKPDEKGNIVLIKQLCFGPIEAIIYGINKDNNFYLDQTYPLLGEDELEKDFKIIDKDCMIKVLLDEIKLLERLNNDELKYDELIEEFKKALKFVENFENKKSLWS